MKLGGTLIWALFVPCLFCVGQEKDSSAVTHAQVATAGSPMESAADTYVIGPTDTLTVTVWKEPTLTGSILVRPDGVISLPLLGDVPASGLTPLQLASSIQEKLKKFIQDPNVSVVLTQIHSKTVYLLGEV